jgi:hypothetical protein
MYEFVGHDACCFTVEGPGSICMMFSDTGLLDPSVYCGFAYSKASFCSKLDVGKSLPQYLMQATRRAHIESKQQRRISGVTLSSAHKRPWKVQYLLNCPKHDISY